ncbi:MAG: hypothetical protein J5J00_07900 [Deltaproteobacteria bacterium]|nr:hypothetical protein [Deltaproteobacteria bacterium]
MGRPIYSYELSDPDFSWLISNFRENHPDYSALESSSLPVVFISSERSVEEEESTAPEYTVPPQDEQAKKADLTRDQK